MNSDGAAAYYDLDTTGYANGVHTIAWIAVDNAANADGIGSRFFNIVNTEGGSSSAASSGVFQALTNVETLKGYLPDPEPLRVSRNGGDLHSGREIYPDSDKVAFAIEMNVLSAISVDLNAHRKTGVTYRGYLQVGNELRRLPLGSTLDGKRNLFHWQPAPGFLGRYNLVFVDTANRLVKRLRVTVK